MAVILEIGTENIAITFENNFVCVQKGKEIIKSVQLRDVRAVMVTAKNVLLGQSFLQNLTACNIPIVLLDENFLPASFLFPCNMPLGKGKVLDRQA